VNYEVRTGTTAESRRSENHPRGHARWSAAVFRTADTGENPDAPQLGATGYLLDQTPQVDDLGDVLTRAQVADAPPPLGPFRTFQVPIGDLDALTGLDLSQTAALDRYQPVVAAGDGTRRWRRLAGYDQITL
jgi:endonuclease G